MGWFVSAIGKPKAVAKSIAKQIASVKCAEPEETIKAKVGDIVATALAAFPEGYAVQITASGLQGYADYNKPELGQHNQLSVEIKPLWNFAE